MVNARIEKKHRNAVARAAKSIPSIAHRMEANRKHRLGQRAILAAFEAEPGNAFLLSELCRLVYPGLDRT
jgi:hypothetical protein